MSSLVNLPALEVDSARTLHVGDWLAGRWLLEELLGVGGAATVYRAVDRAGTRAAIKLLHPELAAERASRERFVREAYAANRIDHPGVARVLEDGEAQDGRPYLAMELLEGETIEARRRRLGGRLSVEDAMWVVDRALDVLAAAHARGIVHRDVKPDNLFLTYDQKLVLLDFGIARLGERARMTRQGVVLGTIAYMSPEQARGEVDVVGVRSDLWAVGATLFALLAGRPIREESEDVATALQIAANDSVPSLADVAPDVPPAIVELVDCALAPDATERWSTAAVMRRAARRAYARWHRRPSATPVPPEWTTPLRCDSRVQRIARDVEERRSQRMRGVEGKGGAPLESASPPRGTVRPRHVEVWGALRIVLLLGLTLASCVLLAR
jgi:serine/threonine-protein kinase